MTLEREVPILITNRVTIQDGTTVGLREGIFKLCSWRLYEKATRSLETLRGSFHARKTLQ